MIRSPALTPAIHLKVMRQLLASTRFLEGREKKYRKGNQQVAAVYHSARIGTKSPPQRLGTEAGVVIIIREFIEAWSRLDAEELRVLAPREKRR